MLQHCLARIIVRSKIALPDEIRDKEKSWTPWGFLMTFFPIHGIRRSDRCKRAGSIVYQYRAGLAVLALVFAELASFPVAAQDLSPRAYWPTPKGTKALVIGYAIAEGDVLFDPSVPLYGVDSELNAGLLAYVQTLSLWGRTSNLIVELPYAWGETRGFVGDTPARKKYSGFSDLGVTLSANLMGAPSMTVEDFQAFRADPHAILGASLKVIAPSGEYDETLLINEGANRWALKVELGYTLPLSPRWLLEFEAGALFFGDDDEFLAGKKEQEPIYTSQMHVVRRFSPGFWGSLNLNYFTGGRQTIDGTRLGDVQRNSRLGTTFVFPVAQGHAIKVGYAVGWLTRFGTDFDQFLVSFTKVLN